MTRSLRAHPKVSIVTISLNQAQFLESAISSVLHQDYDNIEYILVDPGSTDGSREIIESYRSSLAHVVLEPDAGPADGLNRGFALATGDILGCLNADDEYLPGTIRRVVAAFEREPRAAAIYGHGYIIDSDGALQRRFRSTRFSPWRYMYGAVVVMQQATFFRRDDYLEVGGFNIKSTIRWDAELLLDLALKGKRLRLINEYWGLFRIHEGSITNSLQKRDSSDDASRTLADTRARDWIRIHRKVLGRDPRRSDQLLRIALRVHKWMIDPLGFLLRIREVLIGPRPLSRDAPFLRTRP